MTKPIQASPLSCLAPAIARWSIGVCVLSGAFALLFYRLGEGSLYDWDEAIYAQAAKEMFRGASWTHITWNGQPFFHKPPLYFWLTALTYYVTGVNELGARVWAALFGFGTLTLTCVFGWRLHSWVVGVGAVLLLLGVDQAYYSQWWNFLSLSRVGMMDTPLTFWITLAMLLLWEAERRPWVLALLGLPVGLAVLTKAWPGLLPIVIALCYRYLTHKGLKTDLTYWGIAAGLATAVIIPWHLWQYGLHGHLFLQEYVGFNLIARVLQSVEEHHGSPWFYVAVIQQGFSAWTYVLLIACVWGIWKGVRQRDRGVIVLLLWGAIPLLLFSIAKTKLGWYINMIYPALALLTMRCLINYLGERTALGVVVLGMALCCWRLPAPADGAPEVKAFASMAAQVLTGDDTVYVMRPWCAAHGPSVTAGELFLTDTNLRTSLVFYMDRPLLCIPEQQVSGGVGLRDTYVITDTRSWPRYSHLGRVAVRTTLGDGTGYVLVRMK